eukprot:GEMP01036914.1.p1 GENE.GEMP01036914.1~~GEMP01036914.1.p1  ORF type:complete len:324 (+),score=45.81 GEMP01036914.1:87-1058(+)
MSPLAPRLFGTHGWQHKIGRDDLHNKLHLLTKSIDRCHLLLANDDIEKQLSTEGGAVFQMVRRGFFEALRLEEADPAIYEKHIRRLTSEMDEDHIRSLVKFIFFYVSRRSRPLNRRQITECLLAVNGVCKGSRWAEILRSMLPEANLLEDFVKMLTCEFPSKFVDDGVVAPSPRIKQQILQLPGAERMQSALEKFRERKLSCRKNVENKPPKNTFLQLPTKEVAWSSASTETRTSIHHEVKNQSAVDDWWTSISQDTISDTLSWLDDDDDWMDLVESYPSDLTAGLDQGIEMHEKLRNALLGCDLPYSRRAAKTQTATSVVIL